MNVRLPRTITQSMQFKNGCATGMSHRWKKGQYCSIMTEAGIVGCGIYDLATAGEFGQAIAIAKGTPQHPLVDPDDLLEASIVAATPQALALGIQPGMSGRAAVELMLAANTDTA
ncbi:YunC family protein [bacterium]|nr:YunC family protein [bacterium]MDB4770695.1 YunC family protein [bacterium]